MGNSENDDIKVVELFAGVGGFRIGLEKASKKFKTIWANQWEPSTKVQHAFDIYNKHFPNSENVNQDINNVWKNIPNHDLLVGGFPCQDYSVAHGNKAQGIKGKKGVLWWVIRDIIELHKPKMILLENVDRLLNSPSFQRGRDFAIMLRSLNDLGYLVEWKSINAADYGFPQKRRRVFIYAYKYSGNLEVDEKFILNDSILNNAFPNSKLLPLSYKTKDISKHVYDDLAYLTDNYGDGKFNKTGISYKGHIFSCNYEANYNGHTTTLEEVMDSNSDNYVFLDDRKMQRAKWTKDHKKIERVSKSGFKYNYTEGQMKFPDNLNSPGRTMLTSEGTINRSSHFIEHKNRIRFLTPIEAERLNGFPDNWTKGKSNNQRFFFMGNALVVGVVVEIGKEIYKREVAKNGKFIH